MFGREHGVKIGSGGMATDELVHQQRKERQRQVFSEVYNIANDPYIMHNNAGKIVCRQCKTSHPNEYNYIIHSNSKKHRQNLLIRQKKFSKTQNEDMPLIEKKKIHPRKTPKIGKPGYDVYKQYSRETQTHSQLFRISYPNIEEGLRPRYRFISSFEQKKEPVDPNFQYILFAAEPYEIIAFKIPLGKYFVIIV